MTRSFRTVLTIFIAIVMTTLLAACTDSTENITGKKNVSITDQLGGTLTLHVPTNAVSRGDEATGLLTVGTSEAALSTSQAAALPAGEWGLAVGALPLNIVQALVPAGQTVTPQIAIDSLKTQMAASVAQVTFSASAPSTIGGHNAARLTGTSPQGDVLLIAIALDNSYLIATGVTAPGELASREALMTDILAGATYTTTK